MDNILQCWIFSPTAPKKFSNVHLEPSKLLCPLLLLVTLFDTYEKKISYIVCLFFILFIFIFDKPKP